MSDPASLAIQLPKETQLADRTIDDVDLNTTHVFWLGRKLWLQAVGFSMQATFLLAAGIFLLVQIPSTPNLRVQIALTGAILTIGGVAMLVRAAADLVAHLSVDRQGIRARVGWKGFSAPWYRVDHWSVSDKQALVSQHPGVVFSLKGGEKAFGVPDGHLSDRSRNEIRSVLRAFAYGKEFVPPSALG